MKLKIFKILITLVLMKITLSLNATTTLKSKQVFEVAQQQKNQEALNKFGSDDKELSIFKAAENDLLNNKKNQKLTEKLADNIQAINFNQVSEKIKGQNFNAKTMLTTLSNTKSQAKSKLAGKYSNEIKLLKSQIEEVKLINDKLTKKIIKSENKKQNNKIQDDAINFIENCDKNIDTLRSKLKNSKRQAQERLAIKDGEFSQMFDLMQNKFLEMKSKIKGMNQDIEKITELQDVNKNKIKKGLELDSLTINNKLDIKGVLYSNKIISDEINLNDKVQLSKGGIKINKDIKLKIGKNVIPLNKMINNIQYVLRIQDFCGKDFSKCKIITNEEANEETGKHREIVKNLKKFRAESAEILTKHTNPDDGDQNIEEPNNKDEAF